MRSSDVRRPAAPRDGDRTPMGISLGAGAVAVAAVAMLAALLPAVDVWARLDVMALLVAGFAAVTGDQVALGGVALMVWLVSNGFFENRLGVLSWHGSTDLGFAMVLVIAAAVGLAVGRALRLMYAWQTRYAVAEIDAGEGRDG